MLFVNNLCMYPNCDQQRHMKHLQGEPILQIIWVILSRVDVLLYNLFNSLVG